MVSRFFAVNPALAIGWAVIAVACTSTAAYYYDKVYGWQDAEAVARETIEASDLKGCEHDSTSDAGDEVHVRFRRQEPGHYADLTVKRDRQGKWAVTSFNRDFQPWTKDDQASR